MEKAISIGGNITGKINFAMQQNYVPVFRNMTMTNNTDKAIEGVRLRISFEPEFADKFESDGMTLRPNEPVEVSPVSITIHPDYLFSLTEKLVGSVKLEAVQGEEVLASETKPIELLAYDQWTGVQYMPETAAAFMMPNHPKVQEIVSKAGKFLLKWSGDPSFTGYQTKNPNVVKMQMGAVYAALQAENIAYTMPPASYEEAQRIRTPDAVLDGKQGTCLDLAVLYAACLEAVHLNPLLIIIKGHAFAGCWLEEDTFPDSVIYDASAITKRTAKGIDQISLVECTDYTAGKNIDFDHSEKHAGDSLTAPEEFYLAIDVRRTRSSGVRPMPSKVSDSGTFKAVDYGKRSGSEITSAPKELSAASPVVLNGEPQEVTKQVIWERKLLDLSLRNSLLNFRPTAMNVQLMTCDLGKLEDEISGGNDFRVMPMPNDFTLEIGDSRIYEIETKRDLITTIAEEEFKSRRLRSFLSEAELEKTMKKLHRLAKVSIEENGANTIYLALGFLRWYETDKSERPRYSPLVLVPIDIVRRVQDKSYSIRIRDEETQVNITMLEMLRQFYGIDISGLNPVPEDENGVNLPLIFNTIRQGIMAQSRWDIEEYAFIGQFSFSRFIMWNDIRNRSDDLAKNKVVASLMSGKTEWECEDLEMSPSDLDNKVAPSDLAVPTSADSSQLAAVYAASCGKSFVLHGPPGTGKSQTITNMIANALYHGKSVLFVAEKMAALSVVEKRLDKIGLGPFCLELHSNKAQKRAVLNQLEETLNVGRVKSPAEYAQTAEAIKNKRDELNGIMKELHKQHSIGISLYDAIAQYDSRRGYKDAIKLENGFSEKCSAAEYNAALELICKAAAAGNEIGGLAQSPLKNCCNSEYSIDTKDKFVKAVDSYLSALSEVKGSIGVLKSELWLDGDGRYETWESVMSILSAGLDGNYLPTELGSETVLVKRRADADKLITDGKHFTAITAEILADFENTVLSLNGEQMKLGWKRNEQKWFLPKYFGKKKLVKELQLHAKTADKVTAEVYPNICDKLTEYANYKTAIVSADTALTGAFGELWKQESTDFAKLEGCIASTINIRSLLDTIKKQNIKNSTAAALKTIKSSTTACEKVRTAEETQKKLAESMDVLTKEYGIDFCDIRSSEDWLTAASEEANGWKGGVSQLKERTVLQGVLNEMDKAGLSAVNAAYRSGKVGEKDMKDAFICAVSQSVIAASFSSEPSLSKFHGTQFELTLEQYKETLSRFEQLTIQQLVAELSEKIPVAGSAAGSSEVGILQKAIKSGGRMMSIRKLFDSIPNLLRRMCPCMLMSPISVAQYIDPAYPKFDLVIFDEASQLPTCEAVGAIARGENVIVVGDPKQLPPTSFFASNTIDEENYEKEDLESVLDDCLALSMPQKHLLWHYRSRHESLIAYSNVKYYENKLYTFPSPDDQVSEVSWVHVEGYYDKGASKQNKAEAEAVVAEICRRLRDEELRKQSIGVVTFSMPQQNLIDDMLTDAYREDPQLEAWANEMYEPLFIKNLENVQGDERDIILFSIGYGPDKDGKVSMNFGPLNRDGGWRRLNVAISRARCSMVVFSVITPDQIDLSRTRSDGVEGLKGFLEFAAKGRSALASRGSGSETSSEFVQAVAEELRKSGYGVKCGVGCSDYKIDIAVQNPDEPDKYIMGICCCGKAYLENGTASDRSISQPSVLTGLGWNVMNVYALDWLDNRDSTLSKITAKLEEALEKYRSGEKPAEAQTAKKELVFEKEDIQQLSDLCDEYKPFAVTECGTSEGFTEANRKRIAECIEKVLEAEAPIERNALAKKVLACWGINRAGSAMKRTFDDALASLNVRTDKWGENEYIWAYGQEPEKYGKCRAVCADECRRAMDEIAPQEVANGIELILSRQIAMDRSDLLRETAHLFGYTRIGGVIETACAGGIKVSRERGKLTISADGKITYCGD